MEGSTVWGLIARRGLLDPTLVLIFDSRFSLHLVDVCNDVLLYYLVPSSFIYGIQRHSIIRNRLISNCASSSPVTRWATIAFGAAVGIGSAYSDCSQKLDAASTSPSVTKDCEIE
ncbi:hypothetical protein L1887_15763 [Cichorium endivia]|nr:hypothetical protein L1887_15763 [Cichorium endivia]